jgi:hypothetical protein
MDATIRILKNERGSIMAVALILLALLTLIGISSTTTSTTEVQIATNNQSAQMEFYLADSGWRQGAMWVENRGAPPMWVNSGNNLVKNFGADTAANAAIPADFSGLTPDNLQPAPAGQTPEPYGHLRIPYYYSVEYLDPLAEGISADTASLAGNEKGFDRFYYEVTSRVVPNNTPTQSVQVRLSKVFKVGY